MMDQVMEVMVMIQQVMILTMEQVMDQQVMDHGQMMVGESVMAIGTGVLTTEPVMVLTMDGGTGDDGTDGGDSGDDAWWRWIRWRLMVDADDTTGDGSTGDGTGDGSRWTDVQLDDGTGDGLMMDQMIGGDDSTGGEQQMMDQAMQLEMVLVMIR